MEGGAVAEIGGGNGAMAPEIFKFLEAPTGIGPLDSGALGNWPQTRGTYRKGPL